MIATELLAELRSRGVQLEVTGTDLRYRAPAGALTPTLRASMRDQKQPLIDALKNERGEEENGLDDLVLIADDAPVPVHSHPVCSICGTNQNGPFAAR